MTIEPLTGLDKFERYLAEEFYDDYVAGEITRRTFVRRLFYITGSMAAVGPLMLALGCTANDVPDTKEAVPSPEAKTSTPVPATPSATAAVAGALAPVPDAKSPLSAPEGDPSVRGEMVRFPNGADQISGYLARPASGPATGLRGVLICHENAGYSAHFGDIARRFAKEGYVAIALDLLSREGGTANMQRDQVSGTLTRVGIARHVADFDAARRYLGTLAGVDGARIGMIGFCFGGGVTWEAATKIPELKAVVPFYGPAPDLATVPNIKAAAFGVYAENDARITGGSAALDSALTAAGVRHQMKTYAGVGHGFFNDTRAYTEVVDAQAQQAWRDTLAWFQQYL
jgi:carboxymethylenebutenolidase